MAIIKISITIIEVNLGSFQIAEKDGLAKLSLIFRSANQHFPSVFGSCHSSAKLLEV